MIRMIPDFFNNLNNLWDFSLNTDIVTNIDIGDEVEFEYEYNEQGNCIHQWSKDDKVEAWHRYENNNRVRTVWRNNDTTANIKYNYDDKNRLIGCISCKYSATVKYDENGNETYFTVISENDDINYYRYSEYDSNNNLIYVHDSEGKWSKYEYDEKGACIHLYGDDPDDEVFFYPPENEGDKFIKGNLRDGTDIQADFDDNGNRIRYTEGFYVEDCKYDENNRLIRRKTTYGDKTICQYDDNGNLIHKYEEDFSGDAIEYQCEYDDEGKIIYKKVKKYKKDYGDPDAPDAYLRLL